MPQFRKKPVVVEARQYDTNVGEMLAWVGLSASRSPLGVVLILATRHGDMTVAPGDWVIKGVSGEFYPCPPEIFAATYDRVGMNAADVLKDRTCRDCGQVVHTDADGMKAHRCPAPVEETA